MAHVIRVILINANQQNLILNQLKMPQPSLNEEVIYIILSTIHQALIGLLNIKTANTQITMSMALLESEGVQLNINF